MYLQSVKMSNFYVRRECALSALIGMISLVDFRHRMEFTAAVMYLCLKKINGHPLIYLRITEKLFILTYERIAFIDSMVSITCISQTSEMVHQLRTYFGQTIFINN